MSIKNATSAREMHTHLPFVKYFSALLVVMKCGGVRREYGRGGDWGIDDLGVSCEENDT